MMNLSLTLIFLYVCYASAKWQLQWHDEFDTLDINSNYWVVTDKRLPNGQCQEISGDPNDCITNRTKNVRQLNGVLAITQIHEYFNGKNFTSGWVNSKIKFAPGKLEIRAAFPEAKWVEPQIALSKTILSIPERGENIIFISVNNGDNWYSYKLNEQDNVYQFNNYSVQWNNTAVIWKFNDKIIRQQNTSMGENSFSLNLYIVLLDLSLKRDDFNLRDIREWKCSSLLIDYVRYYNWAEKVAENESEITPSVEPNRNLICKVTHPDHKWVLKWHDEFDEQELEKSNWRIHDQPYDCTSRFWGNVNCYTNQEHNLPQLKGALALTSVHERYNNREFTGAHVYSKKKFTFGKIEVRAAMAEGYGVWSIISLERNSDENISNITSVLNYRKEVFENGMTKLFNGKLLYEDSSFIAENVNIYDFNVYSIEWNESVVIWRFNGKQTYLQDITGLLQIDSSFTLQIAVSVGGHIFSYRPFSRDDVKQWKCPTLVIDFVRYYQFLREETELNFKQTLTPNRSEICNDVYVLNESEQSSYILWIILIPALLVLAFILILVCILYYYRRFKRPKRNDSASSVYYDNVKSDLDYDDPLKYVTFPK